MKRLAMVLMLFVPLGAFADAPETATVSGTIVDPGGSALPGVSVTLSSPRGDKFTVTDQNGNFRFVGIVPDDYTLMAELQGLGAAQASFHAAAGDRQSVDLTLRAAIEGGVVDVTAETPMVDKFNVTAGTTVTSEIGEQTAGTTRTYYGVINALPGVTSDARNDDIQQTRPAVNGTHFADQGVYIDGVDTTFAKFGGSRVFLPTTAVTEVSMEAGGSSAEYGRYIGSSTNVIVKSGTNRWHTDALWQRQALKWSSDYQDQPSLAERQNKPYPADWFQRCHGDDRDAGRGLIPSGTDSSEVFTTNRQPCLPGTDEWAGASNGYEFSAGGPIRRDKFWFFVGLSEFDDAFSERLLGGDPYDVSLFNDARIFKLNMQPTAVPFVRRFGNRYAGVPELLQRPVVRLLDADSARERQRAVDDQLELLRLRQLVPGSQGRPAGNPGEQVPRLLRHAGAGEPRGSESRRHSPPRVVGPGQLPRRAVAHGGDLPAGEVARPRPDRRP